MLSALVITTHVATVCPDLAGQFTLPGEDGHVAITIAQTERESLTIDWLIYSYPDTAPGTYSVRVDGRWRRQKQWFGGADSTWIAASWRGDHVEIVARETPTDSNRVQWRLAFGLTSKRNLCVGFGEGVIRGRLATRAGGQVEVTPDEGFSCSVKESGGLTGVQLAVDLRNSRRHSLRSCPPGKCSTQAPPVFFGRPPLGLTCAPRATRHVPHLPVEMVLCPSPMS